MPFRETTRIVTVFTKERGKLTLVARGGQRAKNPFGGTLQPLSHVHALIYTRATRSMQILSDCSHVKIYLKIAKDLKKLAVGQRICEFIQSLTEEGQDAPDIYDLLVNVLEALNDPSSNHIIVQLYFQLQLMDCLGFAPAFTKESVEEVHDSGGYLSLEDGTISGTSIDHLPCSSCIPKRTSSFLDSISDGSIYRATPATYGYAAKRTLRLDHSIYALSCGGCLSRERSKSHSSTSKGEAIGGNHDESFAQEILTLFLPPVGIS